MKLQENERYDFVVEKTVRLGGSIYYLLKGPDDVRYLLKKSLYEHYNIRKGDTVDCRVDKINCRGEVFLEPANPHYAEGEEYEFKVAGRDVRLNETGEVIPVVVVKDVFNNDLVVPMRDIDPGNSYEKGVIKLRVARINKGKIRFTETAGGKKGDRIEEDSVYEFKIIDRMDGVDGKEYFLVLDPDNVHHVIPVEQYSYYGLKKGGSFTGSFIRYKESDTYRVEPLNPFYRAGVEYEFSLVSQAYKPDGKGKILTVTDRHGLNHEVSVSIDYAVRDKMVFRVDKIRKGWPLLVPV